MGTYVKDGNSCIGCSCEFPDECGSCNNLKSQIDLIWLHSNLQEENKKLKEDLKEIKSMVQDYITQTVDIYTVMDSIGQYVTKALKDNK